MPTAERAFMDSPLRMLRWEGITVRSDALATLELVRDTPLTANALARARKCSAGSASNTLRRLASVGALETVELPPCSSKFASSDRPLTGYRCTDLGRRLLDAAPTLLPAPMVDQDPEAGWPNPQASRLVRRAMKTQPTSVFDLGRTFASAANEARI